jgi:hypothetical protein
MLPLLSLHTVCIVERDAPSFCTSPSSLPITRRHAHCALRAGVLLFVILAGCLPFENPHLPTLFKKIAAAEYSLPPWLSGNAASIIDSMLQPDPKDRCVCVCVLCVGEGYYLSVGG